MVARANFQEIHEGRGTDKWWVWLDISHKSKKYILERLPKMHSMILKYNNVDISKDPVEISPTTHYTMWGIWFDPKTYETTLKNFFVAGECTMWVHGANRLWGNSLMETMVFWKNVAQRILDTFENIAPDNSDEVVHISPVCEGTLDANGTLTEIRKEVWEYAWIVRTEEELLKLTQILSEYRIKIQKEWIKCSWDEYTNTMMHNRIHTVLDFAELICKWALERKESRGAHYRLDYPEMDERFARNYLHQVCDGKIVSTWKDVPAPSSELQYGLDTFEEPNNYGHQE